MDKFSHSLKSKIVRIGNSQGIHLPHYLIQERDYPTRVPINFKIKNGQIALEQLRTVDKSRLIKHPGKLGDRTRSGLERTERNVHRVNMAIAPLGRARP